MYLANAYNVAYDSIVPIEYEYEAGSKTAPPFAFNTVALGVGCLRSDGDCGAHGSDVTSVAAAAVARLPFPAEVEQRQSEEGVARFGKQKYRSCSLALAALLPSASNTSSVLVLHGSTLAALQHLLFDIGLPTVPPMMRAPFGNMLPGVLISEVCSRHRGYGGTCAEWVLWHAVEIVATSVLL